MSEPKSRAIRSNTVTPGILNWRVHDDRIKRRSDAFAVKQGGVSVLRDQRGPDPPFGSHLTEGLLIGPDENPAWIPYSPAVRVPV